MDTSPGVPGSGASGTPQGGAGEVEARATATPSPVPYRRTRGIRLNELDRSQRWVIGFSGRRWEVVGPLPPAPAEVSPCAQEGPGERGEAVGPSADPGPLPAGRHSAAPGGLPYGSVTG